MNSKLELLIIMIENNMSISEISNYLDVSYTEIYKMLDNLKNRGYEIIKKYYSNGNTSYSFSKQLFNNYNHRIITSNKENTIDLLAYSDLHYGSIYETPNLVKLLFEYSKENNIHIHLIAGDFIEGTNNPLNIKIPWDKQINHALNVFPHRDDILSFLLLGNHDYDLLENFGINISEIIKKRRGDIIPIGYGKSNIEIKNDNIVLIHSLNNNELSNNNQISYSLILKGHSHQYKMAIDNSNVTVYLPTMSKLNFDRTLSPSFIHIRLKMRYGYIENIRIIYLMILNNKINFMGYTDVFVGHGKKIRESNVILNEEESPKIIKKV